MKTLAKFTLGALVLILALVVFVGRRWDELKELCKNEIVANTPAPGGRVRAVLFRRNCGAQTGFSTQVSVVRGTDSLPNEPGNVFVIGDDRRYASPSRNGRPVVRVRWLDARRLEVRYDARERVLVADTLVDSITIRYVKRAPPGA